MWPMLLGGATTSSDGKSNSERHASVSSWAAAWQTNLHHLHRDALGAAVAPRAFEAGAHFQFAF
jgi:hypothetical protein